MVAVSDATGAGVATSKYSVDGASASLASEFGFTGQLWLPSVQLYYFKARMYSPQLGRFMQRDPLGYAAGLNLYAYAGGDPVNARDPSGLAWECIGGYLYRMDPKPTSMPDDALKSKLAEVAVSGHYEIPPCVQAPTLVVGAAPNPNQGGAGNGGAQSQHPVKDWLCHAGNSVADHADKLATASGKLEIVGVGVGVGGLVTVQPEVAAPGFALAATGGVGSIGAGVLQFGAGLMQGAGGGGYGNSGYALVSLASGYALARGITGPAVSGYRTVSQRATDSLLQNTATTTGGVFDTLTSFVDQLAPQQVSCP